MTAASESASSGPKTILLWTPYYTNRSIFRTGNQELFTRLGCKVTHCVITSDRSSFNKSDAIVFHAFDLHFNDLPSHRWPRQRFVFYLLETIPKFRGRTHFFTNATDNYFNWTMTHRRESDIYHIEPHGVLRRRKSSTVAETLPPRLHPGVKLPSASALMDTQKKVQHRKRLANKTKLAAWFSSNCDSPGKREVYIDRLKKYIDLDVYGKCGDKECLPRNGAQCNNILDEYKFYLSFENSLCPDYITEKFYRALERDVVPVVYGGGDYEAYAPPHSYIHVADFDSPKSLADYLLFLDKNDAMYSRYFEWKKDYRVEMSPSDGWCELCEKLHDQSSPVKWYPSLDKWWYDDAPCYSGDSFIDSLPKDY